MFQFFSHPRQTSLGLGRSGPVRFGLLVVCVWGLISQSVTRAGDPEDDLRVGNYVVRAVEEGSSEKSARERAVRSIPWNKLNRTDQQIVRTVISDTTLFRRMPTYAFDIDPVVYRYFVERPESAVGLWRAMGISKFHLTEVRTGEYTATSEDNSRGTVRVLHRDEDGAVVAMEGTMKSPMLARPVNVRAVVHLRSAWYRGIRGQPLVSHRADLFVSFPSTAVSTVAKLIAPMSRTMIDRNFQEISLFAHVMSQAMQARPGWVRQYLARMRDLPVERVTELSRMTAELSEAHPARFPKPVAVRPIAIRPE